MNMDDYSQALKRRHKRQIENKDMMRAAFRSSLIDSAKLPPGTSIWTPKDGDHFIDIIPFVVGNQMPLDRQTGEVTAKPGEIDYLVDVDVHTRLGSNSVDFICPKQNFGQKCPICQYLRNEGSGDEAAWKKYRTTRRTFYLVWVHDTPEEEAKGIQIWNVAHFFMENKLQPLATLPRGGGYKMYSHPVEGSNIAFTIKKKGMGNIEYLGHALYDRERPIPKSILEKTFALDEVIKMHPTYDEIQEVFREVLEEEQGFTGRGSLQQTTEDDVPFAPKAKSVDWYDDEDDEQETLEEAAEEAEVETPRPTGKRLLKGSLKGHKIIKRN